MTTTLDITQQSMTIPNFPKPLIPRTNWVNWIHDRFSSERSIIIIQAPDGAGKTILLAQFAKAYSDRCFCFFITPDQYISTPKRFYQELNAQMYFAINGRECSTTKDYSELKQQFGDLYYQIARRARKLHPFYFVIDGLEWVSDSLEQESIIKLLPHPYSDVYLLASSRPDQKFNFKYDSETCPFFSESDTAKYFEIAGLSIEEQEINAIFATCQGMPGYLDQLRREIRDSGKPLADVIKNLPCGFRDLLERSWNRLQISDEDLLYALATLAYSKSPLTLSTLAEATSTREEKLRTSLAPIPILQFDHNVSFVTDAHRQFVADKLSNRRQWVDEALIKYYSRDPYDKQSLEQLPILLSDKYDALRGLITIEHLVRTLQEQQDMFLLHRDIRLVVEAANIREDWQTLSKYTLISSMLNTLSTELVLESEVNALLALNDYEHGFELANQAVLPEDRLQLLARVGSRMIQQAENVPDDILSSLEQLVSQINPTDKLKERMIEVAADLFYVHHQAATNLVDKVIGVDTSGRSADYLLAVLALKLEGKATDYAETLRTQISDKKLRDFTRASSSVVAGLSAEQVLAEAAEIEDTSFKLFQLRTWCNSNRENPTAIKVVKQALEIITASEPNPSMRHLRQFAEPLLACVGNEVCELVERLDLLKDIAIKNPAEEVVRLELLIATLEARNATDDRAIIRLYQIYFDLDKITELDIRCYGLVRMLLGLPEIMPDDSDLQKEIEQRLETEFQNLLNVSADHLSLTRRLLSPLTNYNPQMAVNFAKMLNTVERREVAISKIATVYADREPDSIDFTFIHDLVQDISDPELRDWTFVGILEQLAQNDARKQISPSRIPLLCNLLNRISDISDPRARSFTYAFALQMHTSIDETAASRFFERMCESWLTVDQAWERVRLGFDLSTIVARSDTSRARAIIDLAREARSETSLAEGVFAEIYINIIKLAIRSIPDVVKREPQNYRTAKQKLVEVINRIPSQNIQCLLFAELAMRLDVAGKHEDLEVLVRESVLPALEAFKDTKARNQVIINIAPCLFQYERAVMLEELSQLSVSQRDKALVTVVEYLLTKKPIGDPVNMDSLNLTMDYPSALKVCDILEQMSTDAAIYSYLDYLVDSLVQRKIRKNRQKYEKCVLFEKQALTVAKRLAKLVDAKFPDPNNIQHYGYKIAANASIARLRASAAENRPYRARPSWERLAPSWEEIADNARNDISNLADRALVMAWVGSKMYLSNMKLAHELMEEAKDVINAIPNIIDRSNRLNALAEAWSDVDDKQSAKLLLEEAISILRAWSWDGTRDQVTGQILELAHSIEPEFAASLTSTIDNPLIKHNFEQDLIVRDLKREPHKISNRESDIGNKHHLYSELARQLLRSLCSGKGRVEDHSHVREWTYSLADAKFEEVYNMIAWSIENEISRTTRLGAPVLSNLYSGLLDSLELTLIIGQALVGQSDEDYGLYRKDVSIPASLKLFSVGSREEALTALCNWICQNTQDYLKIYDPYFTEAELHILKSVPTGVRVTILTSWSAQDSIPVDDMANLKLRYEDAWNKIADQKPPTTRIYIFGITPSGDSPLHDRFYITSEGRGIRLGTSQSGLGKKDSDIREMSSDETLAIERDRIDSMVLNPPSYYKNERLTSNALDLF